MMINIKLKQQEKDHLLKKRNKCLTISEPDDKVRKKRIKKFSDFILKINKKIFTSKLKKLYPDDSGLIDKILNVNVNQDLFKNEQKLRNSLKFIKWFKEKKPGKNILQLLMLKDGSIKGLSRMAELCNQDDKNKERFINILNILESLVYHEDIKTLCDKSSYEDDKIYELITSIIDANQEDFIQAIDIKKLEIFCTRLKEELKPKKMFQVFNKSFKTLVYLAKSDNETQDLFIKINNTYKEYLLPLVKRKKIFNAICRVIEYIKEKEISSDDTEKIIHKIKKLITLKNKNNQFNDIYEEKLVHNNLLNQVKRYTITLRRNLLRSKQINIIQVSKNNESCKFVIPKGKSNFLSKKDIKKSIKYSSYIKNFLKKLDIKEEEFNSYIKDSIKKELCIVEEELKKRMRTLELILRRKNDEVDKNIQNLIDLQEKGIDKEYILQIFLSKNIRKIITESIIEKNEDVSLYIGKHIEIYLNIEDGLNYIKIPFKGLDKMVKKHIKKHPKNDTKIRLIKVTLQDCEDFDKDLEEKIYYNELVNKETKLCLKKIKCSKKPKNKDNNKVIASQNINPINNNIKIRNIQIFVQKKDSITRTS